MSKATKGKTGSNASRPQSATTSLAGTKTPKRGVDEGGVGSLSLGGLEYHKLLITVQVSLFVVTETALPRGGDLDAF